MEVDGISNGSFSEAKEEPQIEQDQLKKCSGGSETPSQTGCFDCNICLDFVVEPIVTLCGHLYCWPCIYQWLHTDNIFAHQCPVCKASLSKDSFIPLYGRHHHHQSDAFNRGGSAWWNDHCSSPLAVSESTGCWRQWWQSEAEKVGDGGRELTSSDMVVSLLLCYPLLAHVLSHGYVLL